METDEILNIPFEKLGLSDNFCASCQVMGFKKMEDIILTIPEQLVGKKGFSYTWFGELSAFLDKKGLLYLLQPLPGKSCG